MAEDNEENMQVLQQQLQLIMLQKNQLKMQQEEINHALSEIEKASGDMYRLVGPILLQSKKEEVVKDLQERKNLIDSRLQVFDKQEERMKKSLEDSRKQMEKGAAPGSN